MCLPVFCHLNFIQLNVVKNKIFEIFPSHDKIINNLSDLRMFKYVCNTYIP